VALNERNGRAMLVSMLHHLMTGQIRLLEDEGLPV